MKWYGKSAVQGNAEAQLNLGLCYFNGDGVSRNYAEAAKWYCKSARNGTVSRQHKAMLKPSAISAFVMSMVTV